MPSEWITKGIRLIWRSFRKSRRKKDFQTAHKWYHKNHTANSFLLGSHQLVDRSLDTISTGFSLSLMNYTQGDELQLGTSNWEQQVIDTGNEDFRSWYKILKKQSKVKSKLVFISHELLEHYFSTRLKQEGGTLCCLRLWGSSTYIS